MYAARAVWRCRGASCTYTWPLLTIPNVPSAGSCIAPLRAGPASVHRRHASRGLRRALCGRCSRCSR
jgi:hypothetical protein